MIETQPKLIIHGGAWNIPDEYVDAHMQGVRKALEMTFSKLADGMSALDAVEYAVKILEEDPTFDAGKGAFLNEFGEVELDAIIMDGRTLDFGAVAAVQNLLHPVSLARKVMTETEHCLLVGAGALNFAKRMGFEELAPQSLLTERELAFYNVIKDKKDFETQQPFEFQPRDTVGAVALDMNGDLAVATSTGGTARKLQGRVGDSPIVGGGAFADNDLGAVSATGWGESIMKVVLSKRVCDGFDNFSAMQAAQAGIQYLESRVNGLGGVIGISKKGEYGFAYNTPRMARGFIRNGSVVVEI